MIFVVSIEVFILVTLSLLPFLLPENAVVPLFYPGHGLSGNTVITYKVRKTGWTVTIYPKSILRRNVNLFRGCFGCCARELVKVLKDYEILNALLLQILSEICGKVVQ